MKYTHLICNIDTFYKKAHENIILRLSDVNIDWSGMREESLNKVRKQRNDREMLRPVEIGIFPDHKPILYDGRHRIAVAKEKNDNSIQAIITYYDEDANEINKTSATVMLNL